MAEIDDYVLCSYYSALDTFERCENLFHNQPSVSTGAVLEHLHNCSFKVDEIMAIEPDNSAYFISLFQLKKQISILMDFVQTSDKNKKFWVSSRTWNTDKNDDIVIMQKQKTDENINEKQSSQFDIKGILQIPRVKGLQDIVGLENVKKTLKSLVILPKMQPQLFEKRKLCNTILLFGPPGTGKTRLVHGLAAESNAKLFCISASDILSHYVGQTEKAFKTLFNYLRATDTFSILFIDEIDAFCRKRTDSEQEYTRRIKTELMCQLSSSDICPNLFIISATNCPWDLDTAILRRFQKRIYLPLPNDLERLELIQYFLQDEPFKKNCTNWHNLVQKTENFSGSDLSDLVQNALNIPLEELQDAKIWKCTNGFFQPVLLEKDLTNVVCSKLMDLPPNSVKSRNVQLSDLEQACENVKFTVNKEDVKKFELFNTRIS